ncbi:MAG: thioredoxin fold domain-containing protein [candidate division WS1 bacterium]|jgi:tetratricopeptide (TPR) repeat protein|nr:thioredoxin fold domain-containing protein [candidate division WS1 bacterium]
MRLPQALQLIVATAVLAAVPLQAVAEQAAGWHEDFATAQAAAAETGRPVMAVFHSVGCGPCTQMTTETLAAPAVAALAAERFEPVAVNALDEGDLAVRFMVSFYPTVKFLDGSGAVVHGVRGFVPAEGFLQIMNDALVAHAALLRAREAAAADPAGAEAALDVARDFASASQHQEAAEWARKAIGRAAEDATPIIAEARFILGGALLELGEPADAAEAMSSALELAPDALWRWDARVGLGYALLQRGEDAQATALLKSVLESDEAGERTRAEAVRLLRWVGVDAE